jgi:hypothetical protein
LRSVPLQSVSKLGFSPTEIGPLRHFVLAHPKLRVSGPDFAF